MKIINKDISENDPLTRRLLTDRRPGRRLPNIIELPVESAHGATFALDDLTLTPPVKLSLSLHTLSLHDLDTRHD